MILEKTTHKSREQLIRIRQVLEIFPTSRSAWYKGMSEGRYPAGFRLSPRVTVWKLSEVENLLNSL